MLARRREKRERIAVLVQPLLNPTAHYNAKLENLKPFRNIQPLMTIKFTDLGFTLEDGSTILSGVTGEFKHSKLFAVMGPTGAGKSTFLNALSGSASSYGSIKGTVEINGNEAKLKKYTECVGFVPQDDIVHEDLTVMENLLSSVRIRSARGTTAKECLAMVDAVLDLLGLKHLQHSVVGSVEHGGINRGLRKRVNIGTELVAKPSVCFMDEVRSLWGSSAEIALTPPPSTDAANIRPGLFSYARRH
jgi:ABC-type multidrug transport system ATPase subunit